MTTVTGASSFSQTLGASSSGWLGAWGKPTSSRQAIATVRVAKRDPGVLVAALGDYAGWGLMDLRPYLVPPEGLADLIAYLGDHREVYQQLRRLPEAIDVTWGTPVAGLSLALEAIDDEQRGDSPAASAGEPVVRIFPESGSPVDHASWLRALHQWCADHERPTKDGSGYTVVVSHTPRIP